MDSANPGGHRRSGKIARDGEHAARLLLQARADERGTGQGLSPGSSAHRYSGNPVQEPQVVRREEDAGKRLLDEMRAGAARAAVAQGGAFQARVAVRVVAEASTAGKFKKSEATTPAIALRW